MKKKDENISFVDPSFEPNYKSLCSDGMTLPVELSNMLVSWRRPKQIGNPFARVELFAKGVSPRDINQGLVGTCFLLASLSSLAALHQRGLFDIRKLIDDRYSHLGLYGVKLFVRGRWITVPVDDYFPVIALQKYKTEAQAEHQRWESCFCSISNYDNASTSRKELWCPLMEKAFAKVAGSYSNASEIGVGSTGYMLNTLTGLDSERIDCEDSEMWSKMTSSKSNLVVAILRVDYAKALNVGFEKAGVSDEGLVPDHVYSVIDFLEEDGMKLVRLRNPWGHTSWKGDYSRSHKSWNRHKNLWDHARALEEKMGSYMNDHQRSIAANIRTQTGELSWLENDGIFWM